MTEIAAIVIGRNEGARLVACLASLGDAFSRVIYVDSGSTDGSVAAAQMSGAEVVILDTEHSFTAARARNAGLSALRTSDVPDFVQFVDGDCILQEEWIATAREFLLQHPEVAVACGRRRERFPENSTYNQLCDDEWNTPIGETRSCGGDALMRWDALEAVDGFNPSLIAGEEPDMCARMRRLGWKIWRLEEEMTLHDAAILRFGQFWHRSRRGGYAFAQEVVLNWGHGDYRGIARVSRILLWSVMVPLSALISVGILGPVGLWVLMIYPVQIARIALRKGGAWTAWKSASVLLIGKFAEFQGVGDYLWRHCRAGNPELIEYK